MQDIDDLLRELLADAGNFSERRALLHQHVELRAELADAARSIAISTHAKRIRALNVEQVGDFIQDGGDAGVALWHGG
jgi:hypothetical protein